MKILIADDELQIRTGLAEGIPWHEYGISEVITAENGIEAWNYCQEKRPELILTDIRMPGMNGLELGKKISELYQPVEIIILSGYSDFSYAKEAIRMNAFDYLLKPINISDLIAGVERAKQSVEKKKLSDYHSQMIQKDQKMKRLETLAFSGEVLLQDEILFLQNTESLDIHKQITIGICQADTIQENDREGFGVYLEKKLDENLKNIGGQILFRRRDEIYFILQIFSQSEYERKIKAFEGCFSMINKILQNQFATTATCALSRSSEISQFSVLVQECRNLNKHRLYLGKARVISAKEVSLEVQLCLSPVNAAEMYNHIAKFDYPYMHEYLSQIFQKLSDMKVSSIDFTKGVCLELKSILLAVVLEKGVDVESIFEKNSIILNDVPNFVTLSEYFEWIDNVYYLILNGLTQLVGKQHSRAIIQAVDYIAQNYAEDIDLEMVADYVNKSKNYFSYLFKKETGITFVEYLNTIRINQAKYLLTSTDDLAYEISEKVGFSDYKYFSCIFKKLTGTSPVSYRKNKDK